MSDIFALPELELGTAEGVDRRSGGGGGIRNPLEELTQFLESALVLSDTSESDEPEAVGGRLCVGAHCGACV